MANPFDQFDAPAPRRGGGTPGDFASAYGPAAERAGKALGVDPQTLLGQWGLETGWGKSVIPGTNNLGNIKDFAGGGVAATDNMTGSRDKYRAYDTPEAFADDFVSLIQRKYPDAVGAKDARSFAAALKAGGYAEDPRYVDKVTQAARMTSDAPGPVMRAVRGAVEAVVPSAQAAQANPFDQFDAATAAPAAATDPSIPRVEVTGTSADAEPAPSLGQRAVDAFRASRGVARDIGAGAIRGAGSIGATLLRPLEMAGMIDERPNRRQEMDQALSSLTGADTDSIAYGAGKLGGEIAGTAGVGSVVAVPLKVAGAVLPRIAPVANAATEAARTGGMALGASAPNSLLARAMLRTAGGALTGGAAAGLVNPEDAGLGAAIGGAVPGAAQAAGWAGRTAAGFVAPFTRGGQERIAGNVLREFATDPNAARGALGSAAAVVPGSAPTAATASGDTGIAALTRSMQNANPEFAAAMAARETGQNQARTAALEGIAGNTGRMDLARAARDELTGPMREQVLSAAGQIDTAPILRGIDNLLSSPNNAGRLSQQGLNQFRTQIEGLARDGAIDARALYEVRKDIGTIMQGRLQGEAGNLRYASGTLDRLQGVIDDAIDLASRRAGTATGTELSTAVRPGAVGPMTSGVTNDVPRASWRDYLQTYSRESIPINQMEELERVLKQVQTGSVDQQGSLVLSAAKLNNILKNEGAELGRTLSPEQIDVLRRISADLNASQLAQSTGVTRGQSATLQNLSQNQLLQSALGPTIGGSRFASAGLGRLLQLPYGIANQQIQGTLGEALLNPQMAGRLLAPPQQNELLRLLGQPSVQLLSRTAPVVAAQ